MLKTFSSGNVTDLLQPIVRAARCALLPQLGRLAFKAKEHQPVEETMDGTIAAQLVLSTLETASELAIGTHALKWGAAFFGGIAQAGGGNFVGLLGVHAGPVQEVDWLILLRLHGSCVTPGL
jgi:hypothetical protein